MKAPTSKRQDTIKKTILVLLGLLLSFAIVRESFSVKHDFSGYIIAGEAAWNHTDIYVSHLNTWPPSFSVISIPLYLLNSVNSNVMQFVWLTGFCICLVLCIKWTYELFFNKPLLLNFKSPSEKNETLNSWLFIIPFLLSFRILFEEIVNIQINIYLMTLCLLALKLSLKHKNWQAGFLIAFTIACKVYTVILLPLFLFRKKFKLSAYTLVFLTAIHAIVFAYFGIDTAIEHHVTWFTKDVVTKHIYDYGNQSLWGFVAGIVSPVQRIEGIQYNLFSFNAPQTKLITLALIGVIALVVGLRFIKLYNQPKAWLWMFVILLSFIPLFSPIAWKYYFMFLTPLLVVLYPLTVKTKLFGWYLIPSLCIALSSEFFLGSYFSDVTEAFGVITLSSLAISFLGLKVFTMQSSKVA